MSKIHGSLTRAGKVRKQTPKVDKEERASKLLNGRAKKRQQYQRKYKILTGTAADKKRYKPNRQGEKK